MSEESDTYKQILTESNKKLSTLKILSNFFNHPDLLAILIRTKVIHNLFEGNHDLDIHKLDLFHLQYTSSLIDLFQKLKRSKEQKYLLISDEIHINEGFISRLKEDVTVTTFSDEARRHTGLLCAKLEEAYNLLAGTGTKKIIWTDLLMLSQRRCAEFYRELSLEEFNRLTFNQDPTYTHESVVLEKKLAGKLNIQKFKVKFLCGFHYKNEAVELCEFVNSNDKFIFIPGKKAFYLLEEIQFRGIDISKNQSNRKELVDQLSHKNAVLQEKLSTVKTQLKEDVEKVLESYLAKISGVDFLDDLQNVDEQTNILKAMLNINIK